MIDIPHDPEIGEQIARNRSNLREEAAERQAG
jgi:hypothetical protein